MRQPDAPHPDGVSPGGKRPSRLELRPSNGSSAKRRCLVIVPVFNERASVGKVVRRLRRSMPDYDVLVIDDGSTDDTLRQIPAGVTVVSLPFNLGIGGAM